MSIGELLNRSFELVRRRFQPLALCVLVVVAPLTVLATVIQALTVENAFDLDSDAVALGDGAGGAGGALAASLIGVIGVVLATGACFRVIEADTRGETATWRESLAFAAARLGPLLLTAILYVLGFSVGFVLCIVPGIFIAVAWSLAAPAVLYENRGATSALGRSHQLVKGNWWRVFGAEFVMFAIAALIQGTIGAVVGLLALGADDQAVNAVLITIATILGYVVALPLQSALSATIFFALRGGAPGGAPAPAAWPPPSQDAPPWQPPQPPGGFLPPEPPAR